MFFLVTYCSWLVINFGHLIPTTDYLALLLLASDYFSLLLVPCFSNNEEGVDVQLSHR